MKQHDSVALQKASDERSFRHFHEDIDPINSRRFAFETQKTRIYANIKNMFGDALSLRRLSLLRFSRNTIVLLLRLLEILTDL